MRITGYRLMDRLEELQEQAKTLDGQFKSALFQFKTEAGDKLDPRALMHAYLACEEKIARLQEAQAAYNLQVTVSVQGEAMTLQRAVKLIGSLSHVKNAWRTAAQETPSNRYMHNIHTRDKDSEYAERMVSIAECLQLSEVASKRVTALKQVIRSGNATEIEIEIDPGVFA
ncbi:MAG TPA: hypothetical protein VKU00_31215 [Chthonomonadaceae bacterium]|nr:hypothetical protein [Chthonomonadaceae bacterium]